MILGGALDTEGLEYDVQGLFRKIDDGTAVVHQWFTDVRFKVFKAWRSWIRR